MPGLKQSGEKPGPGAYTPHLPGNGLSMTFHRRLSSCEAHNPNVWPGKYDIESAFQPNKLVLNSKFKSAKNTKFAPLRNLVEIQNRKSKRENVNLGEEFACDKKYQINKTGSFYNSKYKNSMCQYFGKEDRAKTQKTPLVPGPGAYSQLSEFGFYKSSTAVEIK